MQKYNLYVICKYITKTALYIHGTLNNLYSQ